MKITLTIDNAVMQRLREEAARSGCSTSDLVAAALRRFLAERAGDHELGELPPLPEWASGGPRVNVADRNALAATMNDD